MDYFNFRGEVIYPSLTFSVSCLDFGVVSLGKIFILSITQVSLYATIYLLLFLGVPKTLQFDVINESVVNVNAFIKISTDGPEISSIKLIDYAVAERPKPLMPEWPREFNIEPNRIALGPESRVSLKV